LWLPLLLLGRLLLPLLLLLLLLCR